MLMNWKIKNDHRIHLPAGEGYGVNTETCFHSSPGHTRTTSAAGVRPPWRGSLGSGEGAGWAASVTDKIDD